MIGPKKREATLSAELRRVLARRGVWSLKTNERVTRGIPDIYMVGGNWIETKVIQTTPTVRNYPLKYFTALQRITADTLVKKDDMVFVAVLWYEEYKANLLFMPWYEFRRIRVWDLAGLIHFSQHYIGEGHINLDQFGWVGGSWDYDNWRKNIFQKWPGYHNIRAFDINARDESTSDLEGADADAEGNPGQAA